MTLYEELELTPDCSFDDIKQQYRILAGIHHPDKGGDEEKFKRIKFAYEVLSDPVRRKQYDDTSTTEEPRDIHVEAVNHLSHIFHIVMPNFDPRSGNNLIEIMKIETNKNLMLIIADQTRCEKLIENLELTKEKIKVKNNNTEDIVSSFLNYQLEARRQDLEIFKYRIEVINTMSKILENYEFGFLELVSEMPTET